MLTWWRSEVNRSFFLSFAACRMRANACDTLSQSCAWRVLCWSAFPLVPVLGSTDSAADCSALFAGFTATIPGSDFPPPYIIGYGSRLSDADRQRRQLTASKRDLPGSDAIHLRVICSSTPAERQCLA